MSNRMKVKKTHKLKLQVHLYSYICHLQVVSHGTIACMLVHRSKDASGIQNVCLVFILSPFELVPGQGLLLASYINYAKDLSSFPPSPNF